VKSYLFLLIYILYKMYFVHVLFGIFYNKCLFCIIIYIVM
jgi:hypothetical protein